MRVTVPPYSLPVIRTVQTLFMGYTCLLLATSVQSISQTETEDLLRCAIPYVATNVILRNQSWWSCPASGGNKVDALRTSWQQAIEHCQEEAENITQDIHILVPEPLSQHVMASAQQYSQQTGINFTIMSVTYPSILPTIWMQMQGNVSVIYDGWMFGTWLLGSVSMLQGYRDLKAWVLGDENLAWTDILPMYRAGVVASGGQIAGLPVDGTMFAMYYRKDILEHYMQPVPATWDQLLEVVQKLNGTDMNGDGVGDFGICLDRLPGCKNGFLLATIAAPLLQYKGTRHGLYLDPITMQTLTNNPAMAEALRVLKALRAFGPGDEETRCSDWDQHFHRGECLFTFNWGYQFKAAHLREDSGIRGKFAVALPPGSTKVLDRLTNTLVPCTSELCPFASKVQLSSGSPVLVNQAPFCAACGHIGAINPKARTSSQRAVYRFFSYMAQPATSWEAVLSDDVHVEPIRQQMLEPGNTQKYLQAGYESDDMLMYLSVVRSFFNHPNMALDLRVPGADGVLSLYDAAGVDASSGGDFNAIMLVLRAKVEKILQEQNVSAAALRTIYHETIGYQDVPDQGLETGTPLRRLHWVLMGFGVCIVAVIGMLGALWWKRAHYVDWRGHVKAPRADIDTTIVLTDIQDSTFLWETLPPEIMNHALRLHHQCTRDLLIKHRGYECFTEGDAFVLAFHTPEDALAFALDLQEALMAIQWPPELFDTAGADKIIMWERGSSIIPGLDPTQAPKPARPSCATWLCRTIGSAIRSIKIRVHPSSLSTIPKAAAESADQPSLAGQGFRSCTFRRFCREKWSAQQLPGTTGVRTHGGLCVRVGIHSGVFSDSERQYNQTLARITFKGPCLATAHEVTDACNGGLVLMSSTSYERLKARRQYTSSPVLILHAGKYRMKRGSMDLYFAVPWSLCSRLALVDPVRRLIAVSPGVQDAPMGYVTLCVTRVVGAQTLQAWNSKVAQQGLDMLHNQASELLSRMGGYQVETSSGHLLSVFCYPWEAVLWALKLHQNLLTLEWPSALLEHEMCEVVTVSSMEDSREGGHPDLVTAGSFSTLSDVGSVSTMNTVLFRGPRVKTGVDVGVVEVVYSSANGRFDYKSNRLARASRVAGYASTGQVCCSDEAWTTTWDHPSIIKKGITGLVLSPHLRNPQDSGMDVVWCRPRSNTIHASRHPSSRCSTRPSGSYCLYDLEWLRVSSRPVMAFQNESNKVAAETLLNPNS